MAVGQGIVPRQGFVEAAAVVHVQRVAEFMHRHVPEQMRRALVEAPGPVLLVDDLADSRWTLTVAGRLLRRAGAEAVLPFTLASAA